MVAMGTDAAAKLSKPKQEPLWLRRARLHTTGSARLTGEADFDLARADKRRLAFIRAGWGEYLRIPGVLAWWLAVHPHSRTKMLTEYDGGRNVHEGHPSEGGRSGVSQGGVDVDPLWWREGMTSRQRARERRKEGEG